ILQSQQKVYTNDYWCFRFECPSFWFPLVAAYEDGDYFFASEPIKFIKELSPDQALLEIKTYNNLKRLSFADWLANQEENYFPYGAKITSKNSLLWQGFSGVRYTVVLSKPQHDTAFWDMVVISKNDQKLY